MLTMVNAEKNFDFGEEDDDIDQDSPQIPKEERKLRTQAYDRAVKDIVGEINDERIILNPEYQRNYIWDTKKASLLIESILLNVPIPVIYVTEEDENKWIVLDGLQRLYSLKRFFDNEFELYGLEILNELNKSKYSDLNPKAKGILDRGMLRIILITQESHPEIKYDIFMRLNQGAITLNFQELRNCLFRGKFNATLKKLRENKTFLKIIGLEIPHNRFVDAELILRFLALSDNFIIEEGEVRTYRGNMRAFLNEYMGSKKNISEDEIIKITNMFESTISKVDKVFGDNAFRKINPDGTYDKKLNKSLMDIVMVSFKDFPEEKIAGNKDGIIILLKELLTNDEFLNSISLGTSATKNVNYRLNIWYQKMKEIMV